MLEVAPAGDLIKIEYSVRTHTYLFCRNCELMNEAAVKQVSKTLPPCSFKANAE